MPWFYGIHAAAVTASAFVVWLAPDLVALNIAAQVINALALPLVAGLLVALAVVALPWPHRPRKAYLWLLCACVATASAAGPACW
ncbi:hypothetical protein [Paraburkholderia sacchari]|uniref:hypothetical protein n=1 Tax=Paraburkholderia sacchari TaxID=159450 RepID=UPI001BCDBF42|nr:hypothetical protein [Paraburkholderia sacchari]